MLTINRILLFLALLFFNSCKRECVCTNIGCPCLGAIIYLDANVENQNTRGFTQQEMEHFYLFRTDTNYAIIDSVKLNFWKVQEKSGFNRRYEIRQNSFPSPNDFRKNIFLIKNTLLGSVDTIADIRYDEKQERRLCNECSGCDDQYVSCVEYYNFGLNHNSINQDGYRIRIVKL